MRPFLESWCSSSRCFFLNFFLSGWRRRWRSESPASSSWPNVPTSTSGWSTSGKPTSGKTTSPRSGCSRRKTCSRIWLSSWRWTSDFCCRWNYSSNYWLKSYLRHHSLPYWFLFRFLVKVMGITYPNSGLHFSAFLSEGFSRFIAVTYVLNFALIYRYLLWSLQASNHCRYCVTSQFFIW